MAARMQGAAQRIFAGARVREAGQLNGVFYVRVVVTGPSTGAARVRPRYATASRVSGLAEFAVGAGGGSRRSGLWGMREWVSTRPRSGVGGGGGIGRGGGGIAGGEGGASGGGGTSGNGAAEGDLPDIASETIVQRAMRTEAAALTGPDHSFQKAVVLSLPRAANLLAATTVQVCAWAAWGALACASMRHACQRNCGAADAPLLDSHAC